MTNNPYQSPGVLPDEEGRGRGDRQPLPFHFRLVVAIFCIFVAGYAAALMWRLIGFRTPLLMYEIRHWLVLIFGIALAFFSSSRLRTTFPDAASIARISFGISGVSQAAVFFGALAIELFIAWYSGVEVEQIALAYRAFGSYVWLWWLNQIAYCSLPVLITVNGVMKRRWFAVPALILLLLLTLVNLRSSYFSNHTDVIPSSWSMFFWG